MESDVPVMLLTEHGLPNVGVEAFVVIRSRVRDLLCREGMVFSVVLEGELGGTGEHRLLQFPEDFPIEGAYLGKRGLLHRLLPLNWRGGRLYVNRNQMGGVMGTKLIG